MNNFDYKKYSLENLEKWIEDAINSSEASPQEIYDVIKNVVSDNYYCYKNYTERCYELLALLNGNGKDHLSCNKDDKSPECQKAWNDFWEENYYPEEHKMEDIMPPWGHSDMEALRYTEEELNAMCEKAESDQENENKSLVELSYEEAIASGWEMTADGFWWRNYDKNDKVVKWQLPVRVDGLSGDCFVEFPDDLMEAANLKEGDTVEWIDRKDGSFELRKVNGIK